MSSTPNEDLPWWNRPIGRGGRGKKRHDDDTTREGGPAGSSDQTPDTDPDSETPTPSPRPTDRPTPRTPLTGWDTGDQGVRIGTEPIAPLSGAGEARVRTAAAPFTGPTGPAAGPLGTPDSPTTDAGTDAGPGSGPGSGAGTDAGAFAAGAQEDAPSGGEATAARAGKRVAAQADMPPEKVLAEARELTSKLMEHMPETPAEPNAEADDVLAQIIALGRSHLATHGDHAAARTLRLVCDAGDAELARRAATAAARQARGLACARAQADDALDKLLAEADLGRLGAVNIDKLLDYEHADTLTVELVQYSLTHRTGEPMPAGARNAFLDTFATTLGFGPGSDDWDEKLPMLLELHGEDEEGIADWWSTCGRGADGTPDLSVQEVAEFSYEPLDALTRWWGKHPDGERVPAPLNRCRAVFGIHRINPTALTAAQEAAATGFATDADRDSTEFHDIAKAATNATVLAYQMRSTGRRTTAASDLTSRLPGPHRDLLERLLELDA